MLIKNIDSKMFNMYGIPTRRIHDGHEKEWGGSENILVQSQKYRKEESPHLGAESLDYSANRFDIFYVESMRI